MMLRALNELTFEAVSHNPELRKRVFIRKGELPYLNSFAVTTIPPHSVSTGHAHEDMIEVFYVSEGKGVIAVDGIVIDLVPETCIAIEPGEYHEVRTGDESLTLIYFSIQT